MRRKCAGHRTLWGKGPVHPGEPAGRHFLRPLSSSPGQPTLAGYRAAGGYLLGDTLDGPIARLTKTSNKFGSEFDTATDHFVQGIAPALIVYAVYARAGQTVNGIV
jgi:hypothetical protein